MKKILFIKLGALGDLSYALPGAQALKKNFNCELTWLVGKSCHTFLKNHPWIDHLQIIDDKKLYGKNIFIRAFTLFKLFFHLRKRFDIVIIAHRDRLFFHAFKFLAREKIFQLTRETRKNTSRAHYVFIPPLTTHESLSIKKLIKAVLSNGYDSQSLENQWHWDYSHIPKASIKLPEKFIVLHLGGGSNSKTEFRLKAWPHWAAFIKKLLIETNSCITLVGASFELSEYEIITDELKNEFPTYAKRINNLIGKTTLPELVDVIRRAEFFIGVDSGPLHIADSLQIKSIGLFGPTSVISWGLLSPGAIALQQKIHCSPCYRDDGIFPACAHNHQCMKTLTSEQVFSDFCQAFSHCET